MSKLNEKDTELYIHEKYIINLSAEENIFTDDVMKKYIIYQMESQIELIFYVYNIYQIQ